MITNILPNMIPMRDIKNVSDGDRLFYERGYKKSMDKPNNSDNWIRTGQFIEVGDVKGMIRDDKFLSDLEYLEHHNFMLIKKQCSMFIIIHIMVISFLGIATIHLIKENAEGFPKIEPREPRKLSFKEFVKKD